MTPDKAVNYNWKQPRGQGAYRRKANHMKSKGVMVAKWTLLRRNGFGHKMQRQCENGQKKYQARKKKQSENFRIF